MIPLSEFWSDRLAVHAPRVLALLLAVALIYRWLLPKPLPNFPHNPITSILGDVPEITRVAKSGKSVSEYYPMLVKRHGPIVQMFIAKRMFLIVGDRKEAERLLLRSKNVDMPPLQFLMFAPIMPNGLMGMPNNDAWKHHRRVLGPSMNQRYLSRMAVHVSDTAKLLVRLWDARLKVDPSAFSAEIDVGLAILDSISTITVGTSLGSVESVLLSTFHEAVELPPGIPGFTLKNPQRMYNAVRNITHKTAWGMKLPFPSITYPIFVRMSPSWRRDGAMLRSFLMEKVTEARHRLGERSDGLLTDADCVLDMLIQQEIREGASALTTDELLDELMVYFVAGHESTAMSLVWLLKYLPKDPEIQRQLRDELCRVFGNDGTINAAALIEVLGDTNQLPVLEAVINETLRHGKVVGATVRYLLDDEVIMGQRTPKGTNIMLPLGWFGNWESDWGPDVTEWRPSRWLRPDGSFNRNAGPDGYPFGLGHRSCFGQKLAMMQLRIFVATIAYRFLLKPVPPEFDSWDAVLVVTKQPRQGYVALEQWK